jgi:hypothetical protein
LVKLNFCCTKRITVKSYGLNHALSRVDRKAAWRDCLRLTLSVLSIWVYLKSGKSFWGSLIRVYLNLISLQRDPIWRALVWILSDIVQGVSNWIAAGCLLECKSIRELGYDSTFPVYFHVFGLGCALARFIKNLASI